MFYNKTIDVMRTIQKLTEMVSYGDELFPMAVACIQFGLLPKEIRHSPAFTRFWIDEDKRVYLEKELN